MALQRQLLKRALDKATNSSSGIYHRREISLLRADFSTSPSIADAPPQIPPFDYQPRPYKGPSADEVFQKRKKFLGPSLFHFYQKPVRPFMFSFLSSAEIEFKFCYVGFWRSRFISTQSRISNFCLWFFDS